MNATREFVAEVCALAGKPVPDHMTGSRLPWYSRSVDSTYLTGKRVFLFGDATHVVAAARVALPAAQSLALARAEDGRFSFEVRDN